MIEGTMTHCEVCSFTPSHPLRVPKECHRKEELERISRNCDMKIWRVVSIFAGGILLLQWDGDGIRVVTAWWCMNINSEVVFVKCFT
jgi:hypothetical protein